VAVVVIGSVSFMALDALSQAACESGNLWRGVGPTYLLPKPHVRSAGSMYGFPKSSKASDVSSSWRLGSPITQTWWYVGIVHSSSGSVTPW
jgi:hypothetical protein